MGSKHRDEARCSPFCMAAPSPLGSGQGQSRLWGPTGVTLPNSIGRTAVTRRRVTSCLQGYISRRLISHQGAGAGGRQRRCFASCTVSRKCHPLAVPVTAAPGRLPASTMLCLYGLCSDVRETSLFVTAAPHARTGCTAPGASRSPSTLGTCAVGSGEMVRCGSPGRSAERSEGFLLLLLLACQRCLGANAWTQSRLPPPRRAAFRKPSQC